MIDPHIKAFVQDALLEDIGRGDLFARVSDPVEMRAYLLAKSSGIFGGRVYIEALVQDYDVELEWHIDDAKPFEAGRKLLFLTGDSHTILAIERTLLNLALHASSIATHTARFVEAIKGSGVTLLDTRKTRPMLRTFEKYAVRCGGGVNHRMGLDDCLMLKDTHIAAIDDLKGFVAKARRSIPFSAKIEIECETFDQAKAAMEAGADIVMCDNMAIEEIKRTVALRNAKFQGVLLEASGNVTLETIGQIAKSGVDAISSGSIIHQARWIDLSMKAEPCDFTYRSQTNTTL